jgi:glycosyltransferase involved in cell wall biosynthesis
MTVARRLRMATPPDLNRRIKVLFLIDSLGPGGAERLMIDLLPALRDLGVDSEVIAIQERHGNPVADDLRAVGVDVSTIGIERLRERGALARVTAAIERANPDILHTQLEFADILGSVAASRLGIPSISTIHTLDRPPRWTKEAARSRLTAWTLRRRTSRVIAVSESARNHVLRKAGLPKRHTAAIHNGIDLAPFVAVGAEDRLRTRSELGIGSDDPVIITVAVLRQPKGIADMLAAMPTLLESHPRLTYLVVGGGTDRSRLDGLVSELGVTQSVHFAGRRSDIPNMLAASDLFVLPSLTEALPTVLIEAMAVGVPVVATQVGGVPEIVDNGTTGLLVPPSSSPPALAEAVGRLLDSPRQRRAMGLAGRRKALDRFSIERQASRLTAEYRVLLSREGTS